MEGREGGWTPSFLQAFCALPRETVYEAAGILQSLVDGTNLPTPEAGSIGSYCFRAGERNLCILVGLGSASDDQWCIGLDVFVVEDASAAAAVARVERGRIDRAQAEWDRWLGARRRRMP